MQCPRCRSENCHVLSETDYKGFGFFKGCLGWILFGWVGWLCGLCGMGKGKTRHFWVCGKCGYRFRM